MEYVVLFPFLSPHFYYCPYLIRMHGLLLACDSQNESDPLHPPPLFPLRTRSSTGRDQASDEDRPEAVSDERSEGGDAVAFEYYAAWGR